MSLYLYILLLVIELVFLCGVALYAIGLLYSSLMGAPYVPTTKRVIDGILEKAGLRKGMVFMELGSGDGRIVRRAVRKYGVKGIGIEVNDLLVYYSRLLAKRDKLTNIEFRKQNIFDTDLGEADVIYMFLMPELLRKMNGRLTDKPKKGALLISHGFKLDGWEKKLVDTIPTEPFSTFIYKV